MMETAYAVTGMAASAVMAGGGVAAVMRHMLKGEFVPRGQHDALDRRVDGIEKHIAALPSDHTVGNLTQKVQDVDTRVAVAQTTIEGVNAGLKRVERLVQSLVDQQLSRSSG